MPSWKIRTPLLRLAGVASVLAGVGVGLALFLLDASGNGKDEPDNPEAFLDRVEAALRDSGGVPHVMGVTTATDRQTTYDLYTTQAWFDFEAGAVRSELTKAPGSTLDIADAIVALRTADALYETFPGTDEPAWEYTREQRPACLQGEPALLAMALLCGLGPQEGGEAALTVEGPAEFRGQDALALVAAMSDGRVLRLFVDPDSYLPLGQTMSAATSSAGVLETVYTVDVVPRASLPPDYFDPRAIGFLPEAEVWLRILDDPALGMPVYWPGRTLTGSAPYDAVLTRVEDRRAPPDKNTPGHVLSLGYEGSDGTFRLDYWPEETWETFRALMGEGFLWSNCAEAVVSQVPAGEMTVLRGHEPQAGIEALRPQVGAPGPGQSTPPPFNPFPNGCPTGAFDRFMAVVRVPGGAITINVSYGYCCQDGASFGVFDTEDSLRAIAERLRPRLPGE
jgi:hypothetical protein